MRWTRTRWVLSALADHSSFSHVIYCLVAYVSSRSSPNSFENVLQTPLSSCVLGATSFNLSFSEQFYLIVLQPIYLDEVLVGQSPSSFLLRLVSSRVLSTVRLRLERAYYEQQSSWGDCQHHPRRLSGAFQTTNAG